MAIQDLTFLEQGEFTQIDETVQKYADSVKSLGGTKDNVPRFLSILPEFIGQFPWKNYNPNEFRKRTASEILKSEYYNGCTDKALAFLAIARAVGIPAKYVETFQSRWLNNPTETIEGHVFTNIFDEEQWRIVEPSGGILEAYEMFIDRNHERYVVAGKGLDFSKLYLKQGEIYLQMPVNATDPKQALKVLQQKR